MQQGITIKPAINIYYNSQVNEDDFKLLLHGIEEEGIPYELKSSDFKDILSLSYDACIGSNLGVGLGISNDEIALHFEKLDKSSPLFRMNIKSNKSIIRSLGSNAARLVKRMPFKGM
jgi:hypothetical protein